MKIYKFVFFIFIFSACGIDRESSPPPLASIGSSGELDSSFFNNGTLTFNSLAGGSGTDQVLAMSRDSLGRIVAVGSSVNISNDQDLVVWRFTAGGQIDTSFAGNGYFIHSDAAGGGQSSRGIAVVTDANNDIYVTGTSWGLTSDFDMVVWKIKNDGTLDTSFNSTGVFVHHDAAGGNLHDEGRAIAIDSNGKIVVSGYSFFNPTQRAMTVWRLNTDGTLDTGFNNPDGFMSQSNTAGGFNDIGNGIAIASDDAIYVAGRADSASNSVMALWKVSSTGSLDASFNGTGFFTHNGAAGGNGFDAANDLIIDSAGNILLTGFSRNIFGKNDMVIWRVLPDGSLDSNFSANGFVTFDISNLYGVSSNNFGEALLIDQEDRIVVTGSAKDDLCVWRFLDSGEIDSSFASNGFFVHDSAAGGFSVDSGNSVVEDEQSRLIIGGISRNTSNEFEATFWRLR